MTMMASGPTVVDAPAGLVTTEVATGAANAAAPAAQTELLADAPQPASIKLPTPTPEPGAAVLALRPRTDDAGWWHDAEGARLQLNDSYLYAGQLKGESYIAAIRFDLQKVPRGAPILAADFALTGLRGDQLQPDAQGIWLVQFVAEKELASLTGASFMMAYSAPASITLLPQLTRGDLAVGKVNSWQLDASTRAWLEKQRLDGANSFIVRVVGSSENGADTLFGWDSGLGATTQETGPLLQLTLGPEPTATPPLPTKQFIVATFTSVPENALTAVAMQQTATAVALTTGTYTPAPDVYTPTPFPQNLATVQAAAAMQGLPAVVLETPVPLNEATAVAIAEYATAVALTTGTFTPVPTAYVTPFLVIPSPPADNLQTQVARYAAATEQAASGAPTSTPMPYNAVIAEYVLATVTPANIATAAALAVEATANVALNGPPTPTPWEWYVYTPTPIPQPTPTPTLPVLILASDFTPTATTTPAPTEIVPDVLPPEFRNKIFFKTTRAGNEADVFLLDPVTEEAGKITRSWVFPMAARDLAVSPDGKQVAIVKADDEGVLQIFVRSLEYETDTKITNLQLDSYDPAWSPTGEWIAFTSTHTGNDEIYRVAPDGSIIQQLTSNTWEWDKHPTWSPDGSQIVFFSNRETGRRQLWIMAADGSGQRNLSSNAFEDWDPIWTR